MEQSIDYESSLAEVCGGNQTDGAVRMSSPAQRWCRGNPESCVLALLASQLHCIASCLRSLVHCTYLPRLLVSNKHLALIELSSRTTHTHTSQRRFPSMGREALERQAQGRCTGCQGQHRYRVLARTPGLDFVSFPAAFVAADRGSLYAGFVGPLDQVQQACLG